MSKQAQAEAKRVAKAAQRAERVIREMPYKDLVNLEKEYVAMKQHLTLKTQSAFRKLCKSFGMTSADFTCWYNLNFED